MSLRNQSGTCRIGRRRPSAGIYPTIDLIRQWSHGPGEMACTYSVSRVVDEVDGQGRAQYHANDDASIQRDLLPSSYQPCPRSGDGSVL